MGTYWEQIWPLRTLTNPGKQGGWLRQPYSLLFDFENVVQFISYFTVDTLKSMTIYVKGVSFTVSTMLLRKSAEPDYLALVLCQLQIEFLQPCIQRFIEGISLILILEHAAKRQT